MKLGAAYLELDHGELQGCLKPLAPCLSLRQPLCCVLKLLLQSGHLSLEPSADAIGLLDQTLGSLHTTGRV